MIIPKIPLNRSAEGNAQQKEVKPKWKMLSLHFASVFALFSPYVFSLKYESHATTMGLYRASQLSVHGEDILKEARNFSNQYQ